MPSKGEIYAGIRPATREVVTEIAQIRGVTASLIDNLDSLDFSNPFVERAATVAQAKYEEACMMAVKAYYLALDPTMSQ